MVILVEVRFRQVKFAGGAFGAETNKKIRILSDLSISSENTALLQRIAYRNKADLFTVGFLKKDTIKRHIMRRS